MRTARADPPHVLAVVACSPWIAVETAARRASTATDGFERQRIDRFKLLHCVTLSSAGDPLCASGATHTDTADGSTTYFKSTFQNASCSRPIENATSRDSPALSASFW